MPYFLLVAIASTLPVRGSTAGSTAVIGEFAGSAELMWSCMLFCIVAFSVVTILSPPVVNSVSEMPPVVSSQWTA